MLCNGAAPQKRSREPRLQRLPLGGPSKHVRAKAPYAVRRLHPTERCASVSSRARAVELRMRRSFGRAGSEPYGTRRWRPGEPTGSPNPPFSRRRGHSSGGRRARDGAPLPSIGAKGLKRNRRRAALLVQVRRMNASNSPQRSTARPCARSRRDMRAKRSSPRELPHSPSPPRASPRPAPKLAPKLQTR